MLSRFHLIFAILLIGSLSQAHAQMMAAPFIPRHIYSTTANPNADIAAALKQARAEHKRVILDFGGDWCGDCQVLDIYFHLKPNDELVRRHFVVVHVDIGHMDRNVEVAERYKVPINRGVPALAVLDAQGTLLYSQRNKEYEHTTPENITRFLNRWKG
jgi:thiol:disulfide interchange protein